jgi:hypothetical protein
VENFDDIVYRTLDSWLGFCEVSFITLLDLVLMVVVKMVMVVVLVT